MLVAMPSFSWRSEEAFKWARVNYREKATAKEPAYQVGEYLADYSEPDLDKWTAIDPEIESLFAQAKVVSGKSESF